MDEAFHFNEFKPSTMADGCKNEKELLEARDQIFIWEKAINHKVLQWKSTLALCLKDIEAKAKKLGIDNPKLKFSK